MDIEQELRKAEIRGADWELREKNLRAILEFMTDEEDAATGRQREKRLNRYKLFAPDGQACRYGAGYTYRGAARLERRDATNMRRFPTAHTVDLRVFQTADPNVFLVTGRLAFDQHDEEGNFLRHIEPVDPVHNLFVMEDGRIKDYVEYCLTRVQYEHDLHDIEELRAAGQLDQILTYEAS